MRILVPLIASMPALTLNPNIILAPAEQGYIAYDADNHRLHQLNAAASLLVELCDGTRSNSQVIELALPLLPPDSGDALRSWLLEAESAEVLIENIDEQHRHWDAQELSDLATRLRDDGSVQAAWLCQHRACEIRPDDVSFLRNLGELAHMTGRRDGAREAYEAVLELNPNDAEVRHLLTSLRDEAAPTRVPTECIQQLYRRFSNFYEDNMLEQLGYEGPVHLAELINSELQDRGGLRAVDLGCGTGLAGRTIADRCEELTGVDLSPEMLTQSEKLQIYTSLHEAEVSGWLEQCGHEFDLIVALDTLIYFGDLTQVLQPAASHLAHDGRIAISVERSATPPFVLTDNGRYQHHEDHIAEVAAESGLRVIAQKQAFLRMEYGEEVTAIFTILAHADDS